MSETTSPIPQDLLKELLRSGQLPEDVDLADISLGEAAAVALRLIARHDDVEAVFGEGVDQQMVRQKSREALKQLNAIDLGLLNHILNAPTIDKDLIVRYLQEKGVSVLPMLSNTPPEIREIFADSFTLQVVSADQYQTIDLGNIITESEVPQWFHAYKEAKKEAWDEESVSLFTSLKERWFLLFTVLLGILAAAGFNLNLGLQIPDVLNQFDLFLSFYGMVAISRAVLQINRAEEWNRTTRAEIRTEYAGAFRKIISRSDLAGTEEGEALATEFENLSNQSSRWNEYLEKVGIITNSKKGKGSKNQEESILNQYNQVSQEPKSRDEFINELATEVINEKFDGQAPTVAVVIPTYQTSLEEMERLLASIKDQAYPVTNAFVVYNDNPNDLKKGTQKQETFFQFQELVDRINNTASRNDCQIHLLAQPARGKREAMAMGFVHGLGSGYLDDLAAKHPTIPESDIRQAYANVDLAKLPSFRHDFILNIDSDTEIHDPFAVMSSAILMSNHPHAATTTGDVRVVNRGINLLSEMTYQRYWRAFFVERAAQSPEVSCMSGPWVFMRSESLAAVLDEWYYQEFLGQRCTYGDDRHLSTLFLKYGWESLFCPDSVVLTDCPTDWETFLKQQLRWNKSFNRENFQLFPILHNLSKFVQFDVVYQQTFPFAMLYILLNVLLKGAGIGIEQGAVAGAQAIMPYILSVLFFNELFFGLYGTIKNKDPKFLMSPVYLDYHFGALLWLKIFAFFKMKDTQWGTKGEDMTVGDAISDFEEVKEGMILELYEEVMRSQAEKPEE